MNNILLPKTLERKKIAKAKIASGEGLENSSWVLFFAGQEFNEELEKEGQNINKENIIDFEKLESNQGEIVEESIRKICYNDKNKQLIFSGEYPIIWFKNIEKIKNNSRLEKSLLSVFDPQQNMKLFGDDKINLSKFILISTSSINNMGELSLPLISRLDCINVDTTKPKTFFLDKYYNWLIFTSIFLIFFLSIVIFWPNKETAKTKL